MTTERSFVTRKFYDPRTRTFVNDDLPTLTRNFSWPQRRGVEVKATQGTISATGGYLAGSYRVTGSHYDLAPGTFSLRITRVNVGVVGGGHPNLTGSDGNWRGTVMRWHIRHSRDGTKDVIAFTGPGMVRQIADKNNAIYSFGPGTVSWGFLGDQGGRPGTRFHLIQSMEGVLGVEGISA